MLTPDWITACYVPFRQAGWLRHPKCMISYSDGEKPRALPASEKSAGVPHSRDPALYGLIHKDHRWLDHGRVVFIFPLSL